MGITGLRRWLGAVRPPGTDGVLELLRSETGAGLVEYAVILALVAVGVLVALAYMAGSLRDVFEFVPDHIEAAVTNDDPIEVAKNRGHGWCKKHGC